MALFGEAGPEAIVPLKRGADGNLGIAASGGGRGVNVTVSVHNAPAAFNPRRLAGFERQRGGRRHSEKAVEGMVGDSLSSGSGRRVLAPDFGVYPLTYIFCNPPRSSLFRTRSLT
jgi:hypothetical protein